MGSRHLELASASASAPGLTTQEAIARLAQAGRNEIPSAEKRTLARLILETLADPLLALLVLATIAHLLLGEFRDSIALLMAVGLVIGISARQEFRAEAAVQGLRELSAPRSTVVRDGRSVRIASAEVVPGDLLILEAGDRVSADGVIVSCVDLSVDESSLSGESIPVGKRPGIENEPPSKETQVFSGTIAVRGRATVRVTATGPASELGKLGKSLWTVRRIANSVEVELRGRVRQMAFAAVLICLGVAVLSYLRQGNWLYGVLAGLALAIALIPEEFPIVARIFLAIGAWRLSQNRVLTRNLGALDSLAHTTVLCVDKTGTLTMNKLAVDKLISTGDTEQRLMRAAVLASDEYAIDPIDRAIVDRGHQAGEYHSAVPVHALFLPMAVAQIYAEPGKFVTYVKGAPEHVSAMCAMSEGEQSTWLELAQRAAEDGFKVLGVAAGESKDMMRSSPRGLRALGLVCLSDPLRPGVPEAMEQANGAGVRVVVITGDHPATAKAIATRAGIQAGDVVNGDRLDTLNDLELRTVLRSSNLFCRVAPAQKLRLVTLLKGLGESVAMTGDGVNDAPALKAADVGIAMGLRGTDVARETADLVLLDDDFPSIVTALRTARGIRKKMRRAVTYIVAVHVPIAGLAILPFITGWPMILLPIHIVILELVIDPACAIVFETEPAGSDMMKQDPQAFRKSLLDTETIRKGLLQGTALLLAIAAVFGFSYWRVGDEIDSRTLAFSTLLLGNIALIWLNRSREQTILETIRRPNPALWWITAFVLASLVAVTSLPFLREALRLTRLHLPDYAIVLMATLFVLTLFELPKVVSQKMTAGE
jgi:P-type Ca2+ transporter type 2C